MHKFEIHSPVSVLPLCFLLLEANDALGSVGDISFFFQEF